MRWEFDTRQSLCIDSWQTSRGLSLSKDGIKLLAVALWKSVHTASYWGLADMVRAWSFGSKSMGVLHSSYSGSATADRRITLFLCLNISSSCLP